MLHFKLNMIFRLHEPVGLSLEFDVRIDLQTKMLKEKL